jgi:hypothetical protein
MNDDLSEYKDLIRQIEEAPRVSPPSDFTQRVMRRLPEYDAGILYKLKEVMFGFDFGWGGSAGSVSKSTCCFYYFVTGFFYLIIGIVSMAGLKKISSGVIPMDWIGLQPYLAIGMAIWFFALGVVLMIDGRMSVKGVRYGTMFYIFCAVVNSILLRPYLHIPYASIFMAGMAVTSALMGIMLVQAVRKMELRTV